MPSRLPRWCFQEGVIIKQSTVDSEIVMFIPMQNARICLDCDTVFEESNCPRCSSESFHPLSKWIRRAIAAEPVAMAKKARNTSLLLLASGIAFVAWHFLTKPDNNSPK